VHRWAIKILPVLATAVGIMNPHRRAEDMTAHDRRNTAKIVLHPSAPPRHANALVGHRRNKRDRSEVCLTLMPDEIGARNDDQFHA
jgi:hypothetical protein